MSRTDVRRAHRKIASEDLRRAEEASSKNMAKGWSVVAAKIHAQDGQALVTAGHDVPLASNSAGSHPYGMEWTQVLKVVAFL
jgi:hypothetical protein